MTILQILFQSMDGGTAAQSCDPLFIVEQTPQSLRHRAASQNSLAVLHNGMLANMVHGGV
jgi:hypothetical protein